VEQPVNTVEEKEEEKEKKLVITLEAGTDLRSGVYQ
jgi:hypothetical protein